MSKEELEGRIRCLEDRVECLINKQDILVKFLYNYFYNDANLVSYEEFIKLRDLL